MRRNRGNLVAGQPGVVRLLNWREITEEKKKRRADNGSGKKRKQAEKLITEGCNR